MNESEIENELRRSRPAPPSPALQERIASALQEKTPATLPSSPLPSPASHRSFSEMFRLWLDRLLWSGLGATAALLVMLWQRPGIPQSITVAAGQPSAAPLLQQVLSGDEAMGWQDEGVHFDKSGQPMLKLRRMAVEHQAWADPQNAGVVQVELPRQEVMYVPMSLH